MQATDASRTDNPPCEIDGTMAVRLRLYVARSTPNSVRAEGNLSAVLAQLATAPDSLIFELIDVFAEPKRAINDGVVVTPTLIGMGHGKRIILMGDLADRLQLERVLIELQRCVAP